MGSASKQEAAQGRPKMGRPGRLRLARHMATTRHVASAYPWQAEAGMSASGVIIGFDLLSGGLHTYDPWELYCQGLLTNPNGLVIGALGCGKSSLIKGYLFRQVGCFGRQAYVLDPKGEYGALAAALGIPVVRLEPGGPTRLNPLDPGPGGRGNPESVRRRQGEMVVGLAETTLGRRATSEERAGVAEALDEAANHSTTAQLADVAKLLLAPTQAMAAALATTPEGLAKACREVALELRRLLSGDLAGMFDGQSSVDIDWAGPGVVLDLSAVYGSPALPVVMLLAVNWLQVVLATPGRQRIVVLDEAWAVLMDTGTTRWLQSTWKLSRALGVANMAVIHRLSDLRGQGADGSERVKQAQGLLADTGTRVVFAQASDQVPDARKLLGLTEVEGEVLPRLPARGRALWRVGGHGTIVDHLVAPGEWGIIYTDAAMGVGA